MPYKMFRKDGKFCVKNSETGESKGCSDTRKLAVAHMRALYRAEGMGKKETDLLIEAELQSLASSEISQDLSNGDDLETKDYYNDSYDGISLTYGATSYKQMMELEKSLDYRMEVEKLINCFPALASNIMYSSEIGDKESAIAALANELTALIGQADSEMEEDEDEEDEDKEISTKDAPQKPNRDELLLESAETAVKEAAKVVDGKTLIDRIANAVKEIWEDLFPKKSQSSLMVWKEKDGSWRWFTRYSNTFRDRDNPPEIISSESHRRFVDLVDKGLAPYPDLWLWHVPEWKIGKADFVAYDEVKENAGFAMAAGYFYPWATQVAEWLDSQKEILVSHGMPPASLKYEESDNSIIKQHETREISPLPGEFAANTITTFYVLSTKEVEEEDMAIPEEKRRILTEKYGLDSDILARIENINARDAEKAIGEGIETKENTIDNIAVAETAETAPATEPVVAESSSEGKDEKYPTREELVEVLKPLMESVANMAAIVDGMQKEITVLKENREESVQKAISSTPQASLLAMLYGRAVGDKATSVDESSSLAKSKPKEADTPSATSLGIPFLDKMLGDNAKQ